MKVGKKEEDSEKSLQPFSLCLSLLFPRICNSCQSLIRSATFFCLFLNHHFDYCFSVILHYPLELIFERKSTTKKERSIVKLWMPATLTIMMFSIHFGILWQVFFSILLPERNNLMLNTQRKTFLRFLLFDPGTHLRIGKFNLSILTKADCCSCGHFSNPCLHSISILDYRMYFIITPKIATVECF